MLARGIRAARPLQAALTRAVTGSARKVECRHVLLDTEEQLQAAAVRIESGEDFADVAKDMSQCPSKGAGGRVGWIIRGMADSAIEEAVLDKPVGSVTQVESASGHHLIEVLSESFSQEQAQRHEPAVSSAASGPSRAAEPAARSSISSASVQQLAEVLNDPAKAAEAQFLDVREEHEIRLASVPQFEVLPLSMAATWAPTLGEHFDPDKDTYVLCHAGIRSMHVCNMLAQQGWTSLYNVSGGIARYSSDIDPSVPQY